jgi:hypothetical protein
MQRMIRKDGGMGTHNAYVDGVVKVGTPCAGVGVEPAEGTAVLDQRIVRPDAVPRADCPVCEKSVAARADGTAGVHSRFQGTQRLGRCPGVGGPVR